MAVCRHGERHAVRSDEPPRQSHEPSYSTSVMGSLDTIKAYEEVGLDPTKINLGFAYYAKWFMTDPSSNCGEHRIGCAVAKLESPDRTDPGKSSALTFEKSNMGTAPVNLNVSTEGTSGFAKRTKCPLNSCCSQYGNWCVACSVYKSMPNPFGAKTANNMQTLQLIICPTHAEVLSMPRKPSFSSDVAPSSSRFDN